MERIKVVTNPIDIYNQLDRISDKGPLRPAQEFILNRWSEKFVNNSDTLIKLHTGQGKTLIGLLALQAQLNKSNNPVMYLCPNKILVEQTIKQAKEFGIKCTTLDKNNNLPENFINGEEILVAHIQVLFNGLTKFGLNSKCINVDSIVLDDSHACIESIKGATKFNITQTESKNVYEDIMNLFEEDLKTQGEGTFHDVKTGNNTSFLAVPYWSWKDKISRVIKIIGDNKELDDIKFVWEILKDELENCDCYISNTKIEIVPYQIPLKKFGTFSNAKHRIFMSATTNDDSVLLKDFGIDLKSVENPLLYDKETWSGEKMILFPSQISNKLNRTEMVYMLSKQLRGWKSIGKVALVPSFKNTNDWNKYGAKITKVDNFKENLEYLLEKEQGEVVTFANRYDGIDLPDESCRILIIDSLPHFETLEDKYIQSVLPNYYQYILRQAQKIEQGFGRSVRGEKDYSAILIIGNDLVSFLKTNKNQSFLSQQLRKQIAIGKEISDFAKDDINYEDETKTAKVAVYKLLQQLLLRDESWKAFYNQEMDKDIQESNFDNSNAKKFLLEKQIDDYYYKNQIDKVKEKIQEYIDANVENDMEKGWYFQKMAKYLYRYSKVDSNEFQILAHRNNSYLLKPTTGIEVKKMKLDINWNRSQNIIKNINISETFEQLCIDVDAILTQLEFGIEADKFEKSLDSLGKLLGFETQRPDKEWKAGPDNLWVVGENDFILFECKNEVSLTRERIHKSESGQFNNSIAWFKSNYNNNNSTNVMIINTKKLDMGANFSDVVSIIRKSSLNKLKHKFREFINEFRDDDFKNLSELKIQERIFSHGLSVSDIKNNFSEEIISKK